MNKIRIELQLEGELAEKLENYIERGLFSSKPELVRDALRHLFEHLVESDLSLARRRMMER